MLPDEPNLDRVRSRPAGGTAGGTEVCAYCSRTVPRSAHSLSCPPPGGTEGEDHEAGIEAALIRVSHWDRPPSEDDIRKIVAAYLSRAPSPAGGPEPEDHRKAVTERDGVRCECGWWGSMGDWLVHATAPSPVSGTEGEDHELAAGEGIASEGGTANPPARGQDAPSPSQGEDPEGEVWFVQKRNLRPDRPGTPMNDWVRVSPVREGAALKEIADLIVDVLHGRRHSGELLAVIKPYRTPEAS